MRKLYAVLATVATLLAMAVASSACMFFTYQPEEPESLRDK
ncbi:MAG: cyclic lactone autoinducer peptide [Clostridiales bacterium]|jgi:cyclic lactone autoinducer peptide|nr:cyclic lactone autoinducer peptide [Clostridiales bacterium]